MDEVFRFSQSLSKFVCRKLAKIFKIEKNCCCKYFFKKEKTINNHHNYFFKNLRNQIALGSTIKLMRFYFMSRIKYVALLIFIQMPRYWTREQLQSAKSFRKVPLMVSVHQMGGQMDVKVLTLPKNTEFLVELGTFRKKWSPPGWKDLKN